MLRLSLFNEVCSITVTKFQILKDGLDLRDIPGTQKDGLGQFERHGAHSSSTMPKLPPEIWVIVLDLILDPFSFPYNYCDFASFPLYQVRNLYPHRAYDEEQLKEDVDYRAVALVCTEWRSIAGPIRRVTLKSREQALKRGVRVVTLTQSANEIQRLLDVPEATALITTIILHDISSPPQEFATAYLFDNAATFPALRSLSLSTSFLPPNFWSHLQQSFPHLVSLTLRDKISQPGSLALDQLKILDIDWPSVPVIFHLAALKHCCIRNIVYRKDAIQFMDEHVPQLESLLTPIPFWATDHSYQEHVEEDFWRSCPNLKMIGFEVWYLERVKGPQGDHPLAHLRLFRPSLSDGDAKVRVDRIKSMVLRLPHIKQLSIGSRSLTDVEVAALKQFCSDHSIMYNTIPVPIRSIKRSHPSSSPNDVLALMRYFTKSSQTGDRTEITE